MEGSNFGSGFDAKAFTGRNLLLNLFGRGNTTLFDQWKGVREERVAYATSKWPQSLKMDLFYYFLLKPKYAKNSDF
jgi:hypothetical protein